MWSRRELKRGGKAYGSGKNYRRRSNDERLHGGIPSPEVCAQVPKVHTWSMGLDRHIRVISEWMHKEGWIVFRTPPPYLNIVVWTPRRGHRMLARRFSTQHAPQITACAPGGRFLAVLVRHNVKNLDGPKMDWLRYLAALGGAAIVCRNLAEFLSAWEDLQHQQPAPWAPAADVGRPPPEIHQPGVVPPERRYRWKGTPGDRRAGDGDARSEAPPGVLP